MPCSLLIVTLVVAFPTVAVAAQIPLPPSKMVQVQGRVVGPDGIGLPGATVVGDSILFARAATATTDAEGRYEFEVLVFRGVLNITVTLPGFGNTAITRHDVPDELTLDVLLRPAFETQISVGADIPMLSAAGDVGELTLTPSQSAVLPSLGSRDLFRTFQLLPGVSGSNETSSGLFVRGGTPDQNAIWFDGCWQVDVPARSRWAWNCSRRPTEELSGASSSTRRTAGGCPRITESTLR